MSDNHTEVASLSDEALVRETLPLVSNYGCKLYAAAALVSVLCGIWLGPKVGLGVMVATVGVAVFAQRMRRSTASVLRARVAEREFQRRFGAESLAQHVAEARAQLAADPNLQLLGLFRGRVLPHGGLRAMRVEMMHGAQAKLIVHRSPPLADLQRGAVSTLEIVRHEAPLTAAHVARLRALLCELAAESVKPLASFVLDGFPCEASVLQRDGAELHASANLAGLPEQLQEHPSVRLIELFLDLEAELVSDARLG